MPLVRMTVAGQFSANLSKCGRRAACESSVGFDARFLDVAVSWSVVMATTLVPLGLRSSVLVMVIVLVVTAAASLPHDGSQTGVPSWCLRSSSKSSGRWKQPAEVNTSSKLREFVSQNQGRGRFAPVWSR